MKADQFSAPDDFRWALLSPTLTGTPSTLERNPGLLFLSLLYETREYWQLAVSLAAGVQH
jgi:hypothetical protein